MAFAKGTSATGGSFSGATSGTVAAGQALSVGDVVIVYLSTACDGLNLPSSSVIDDNLGNTYTARTPAPQDTTNHQMMEQFASVITNAGTPTVRCRWNPVPGTSACQAWTMNLDPFTGSDASSATDGSNGQSQAVPGGGADAVSSNTFTPAHNGCLITSSTVDTSTGTDPGTHGTGFTDGSLSSVATTIVVRTEYRVQATAALAAGTFTAISGADSFVTTAFALTPSSATDTLMGQACL